MTVSVVMTSYNGEKYIEKQLASLRDQTYKPDEVIIADDRSKDGTFQLVSSFLEINRLNKWRVYQNKKNVGVILNFYTAMKMATGDFVFFSDQDDIWELSKVEEMINIISKRDEIMVLMSKENRIEGDDKYIQYTDDETEEVRKIGLPEEIKECFGAGHLIVLRKSFMDRYITELIDAKMTFDVPFCVIAAAINGLFLYDKRLVRRRIHGNNTSGIKQNYMDRIKNYEKYIQGRRMRLGYFKFLLNNWDDIVNVENRNLYADFNKAVMILEDSLRGLEQYKLKPLVRELLSHNVFLNKKISVANIMAMIRSKFSKS